VAPPPNNEILESRFFPREELPAGVSPAVLRRMKEIFDGAPTVPHW
jgi:hypothetical protein